MPLIPQARVEYIIRVRRVKQRATATVVRRTVSLPWRRCVTVGEKQWTTKAKDPSTLEMEARQHGVPLIRADQARRGVYTPPGATPRPLTAPQSRPGADGRTRTAGPPQSR